MKTLAILFALLVPSVTLAAVQGPGPGIVDCCGECCGECCPNCPNG